MEFVDRIVALILMGFSLLLQSFFNLLRSPLFSNQHFFYVYLLSSLVIAFVIYVFICRKQKLEERDGRMSVRNFFRFCFPRSIYDHPSFRLDLRYFFLHKTFQGALLPLLRIGYVTALALATESWIMGRYGTAPLWEWRNSVLAALTCGIGLIMLVDFTTYAMHVLQHKVPFLWEFHKVHHSAPVLNPLTNFREHPVDNIFYQWIIGLTNGIGIGLILCLFDDDRLVFSMSGPWVLFGFNLFAYNLRHSHIWLAWPPALGRILGSPANHQIHHSAETRHLDKNFGFIFAIWDWMFGTLYLPRERETFRLGLNDGTESDYTSALRLYFLPFLRIFQSVTDRSRKASG